jgi:hypothetical protein
MSNLFRQYTHPHHTSRVKDESIGNPITQRILPQHRPLFPIVAAKGRVNEIQFLTGPEAIAEYGSETFDPLGKFFRPEQVFLQKAIFPQQGCFIVRLADETVKSASCVLECVVRDAQIQQYERDEEGRFVYDEMGERIPLLDAGSNPIKEPGVTLEYRTRALEEDEKYDRLQVKEVEEAGVRIKVYPVFGFLYDSPGAAGNRAGFKWFFDPAIQDDQIFNEKRNVLYGFGASEIPYDGSIALPVRDKFESQHVFFTAEPGVVDEETARRVSFVDVIENNYISEVDEGVYDNILPYEVKFYDESIKEIAEKIQSVEVTTTFASPWQINVVTLEDKDEVPYRHAILVDSSIGLSDISVNYLSGGSDGELSDEKFEEMFRALLTGATVPEIYDEGRYPLTHLYDVGYSLDTKYAMAQMIGEHPYISPTFACLVDVHDFPTLEESVAIGNAIMTRVRLTPESTVHGTGACRATVMGQSGYLHDTSIKFTVPHVFWIAYKRAIHQGNTIIQGEPTGEGNHENTFFRKTNWFPGTKQVLELLHKSNINYCQIKQMTVPFFPHIQSVYANKSSALVTAFFVDAIIYHKYIAYESWVANVGRDVPIESMFTTVKQEIETQSYRVYGGKYPVIATPYQTKDDAQRGGILRVRLDIQANDIMRRIITDIVVGRENL